MLSITSLPSTEDIRRWLRRGGRGSFRALSKVLFLAFGIAAAWVATTGGAGFLVAAIAAFIAYLTLDVVLPTTRVRAFLEDLLSGEAGARWWDRIEQTTTRCYRRISGWLL